MSFNYEKICLAVIRWGTYLVLLTPLVVVDGFFFLFVGPKTIFFWLLVEIIFAAWLFLLFLNPLYRPRKNLILTALSIFLFFSALSTIFGADPSKSFWSNFERMTGLLTWFHLFAFLLVLASVFKSRADCPPRWHKIFSLSIGVAIAVSLLAIFPKLGLPDILKNLPTQDGATLGNTSFLATYLFFNVFLAIYLFIKSRETLKIFAAVGLVLICLALFSSTGYAAVISFFLGLVLLFILWLVFQRGPICRLLGFTLLGILLLGGAFLLCLIFQPQSSLHQFIVSEFREARFILWQSSLAAFKDRPFFGWGPENFDLAFYKHFKPAIFLPSATDRGNVWFDKAHNILFDSLVAGGIFGLLSYLAIFASLFYLLWKRYFQKALDFWTVGIFSVLLVAYCLQNFTVFDMISSYLMLFLLMAFIANQTKLPENSSLPTLMKRRKRTIPFGLIILLLLGLSLFGFVVQPLRADYYAMKAVKTSEPQKQLILFKKALGASNLGKYQIREFFADALMNGAVLPANKPQIDFIVSQLQKSIKSSPLNFRSHWKLGQLYNFYGQIEPHRFLDAEIALKKAIEISPENQYGYWALADTEMALGEPDKAISLLQKALGLEPRLETSRQKLDEVKALFK